MAKTSKTTENKSEKTTMEKIGETVSHLKEVMIEQKDKLVEAVENKAADIKVAINNFKKKKKAQPKKKPAKKTPAKTAKKAVKKVAAKPVKKAAKKVTGKTVKKAVKKVVKKAKPVSKKKK